MTDDRPDERLAREPTVGERAPEPGERAPDPPESPPSGGADSPPSSVDRRAFFRVFGKQALTTAGQVAGAANAVRRGTTAAVSGVVEFGLGDPRANADRLTATPTAERMGLRTARPGGDVAASAEAGIPGEASRYRSPYRLTEDTLYLLDQRQLPDRVEEVGCRRAEDLTFYIRNRVAGGGPLLAQLAAYALWLTAREIGEKSWPARQAEFRRASQLLAGARPSARMMGWSVARIGRVWERCGEDVPGEVAADAVRAESDAIATEASLDHGAIARAVAALLPRPDDRSLRVLVHGDPGALTSGLVGTGLAALQLVAAEGRELSVWVTETRPHLEGARLAAWELRQAGIDHTVLADTGVAWLLGHEPIDAVLVGAETIAANGDTASVAGSRAVAELAAAVARPPVPFIVCAPTASIDLALADGGAIPDERPSTASSGPSSSRRRAALDSALEPTLDVIPAERITAIATESGMLRAPFDGSLAGAVAEREQMRQAPPAARPRTQVSVATREPADAEPRAAGAA